MTIRVTYCRDPARAVPWLAGAVPGLLDTLAGRTVVIKPNLVNDRTWLEGATTDPSIVEAVIGLARRAEAGRVIIAESSWVGGDTATSFAACGYRDLAERCGVELVDLNRAATRRCGLHEPLGPFNYVQVARLIEEADVLINVAVLKAHSQVGLTMAAKNLKGCLPDGEKKRFHRLGLEHGLLALNTLIRPQLNIVDARSSDLVWELGGHPIELGFVAAGGNALEVDAVCADLIGYDVGRVPYLKPAAELGLADFDRARSDLEYRLLDDQGPAGLQSLIETVAGRIAAYRGNRARQRPGDTCVVSQSACTGCMGAVIHAVERMRTEGPDVARPVCIGRQPSGAPPGALGVGDCTAGDIPPDRVLPGCPPAAGDVYAWLRQRAAGADNRRV